MPHEDLPLPGSNRLIKLNILDHSGSADYTSWINRLSNLGKSSRLFWPTTFSCSIYHHSPVLAVSFHADGPSWFKHPRQLDRPVSNITPDGPSRINIYMNATRGHSCHASCFHHRGMDREAIAPPAALQRYPPLSGYIYECHTRTFLPPGGQRPSHGCPQYSCGRDSVSERNRMLLLCFNPSSCLFRS